MSEGKVVPEASHQSTARSVIAVANAKGGVGKTSIVANIAGLAALAGYQVLAIDLDPQGNLATDLGYQEQSDLGRGLSQTLRDASEPLTIHAVRPGLDVWPGGPELVATVTQALIPAFDAPLTEAIQATGTTYDLVFIDCPPTLGPLVDAGLIAADYLLVPIRADHASLAGLGLITDRFREVRQLNPDLELLGVTMFDVSRSATAIVREVAEAIRESFRDTEPRLLPAIRRAERSAFDMRRLGLLAHEHRHDRRTTSPATDAGGPYSEGGQEPTSEPSSKIAQDYLDLAQVVLAAVAPRASGLPVE